MGYEEQLRAVPLFSRLEKDALERLASVVVSRKHAKGDTIVEQGEQAVAFYVIVSGRVGVTKGGQQLAELGPGSFFGEMALLDGYPRSTGVTALDDTELLAMTRWDFTAELRSTPAMAVAMLPVLSRRIRELEKD
jgi:CRP/FNR family transcriptional regulator, cyclic AMP receptor protein